MAETKGRRLPITFGESPLRVLERGGDYCGPIADTEWAGPDATDERPKVWFLLPGARDEDAHGGRRSLHVVATPPHVFRECADGSLEIRASIACGDYWHGYLDEGHVWRSV